MSNGQSSIQLSKRELQVLEMVVTGASNQEIARQLVISVNTVKVHMRNIFEKLEVQSRTEAGLRAVKEGFVAMPDSTAESSDEPEKYTLKTFLLPPNPPLILQKWQQIYLLTAIFIAAFIALLPFLSKVKSPQTSLVSVPVIYAQPTPIPALQSDTEVDGWIRHEPMPTSRAGLALTAIGNNIYAIGGVRDNNQETRSVEIFDTTTNTWAEGASKPAAAANIAGAVLANKIYVPGGCTNDGTALKTVDVYLPKTDTWEQGKPLPAARCGYGLVVFNDVLYLFGGWDGQSFQDTVFTFAATDNEWSILENKLPAKAGYMGVAALDNAIYIVGGYNGKNELAQTYRFNPDSDEWLEKPPLQEARGGLGLISSDDSLYAIGGGWQNSLSSNEKYNLETDTWTSFDTPHAQQWRNMGLTVIDTKIYAVGGWDGTEEQFMDSVVSYQFLYQLFLPLSGF